MKTGKSLHGLRDALRAFASERDWNQFHSPKNLAAALSVEASEVLELFQWLSDEQSRTLTKKDREKVSMELADVLLYLIRLADKLDVDLVEAALAKMSINAEKYPVSRARGSAAKYTEL